MLRRGLSASKELLRKYSTQNFKSISQELGKRLSPPRQAKLAEKSGLLSPIFIRTDGKSLVRTKVRGTDSRKGEAFQSNRVYRQPPQLAN